MSSEELTPVQPAQRAEQLNQEIVEETPEPIIPEGRSKRYIQLHNAFQSAFTKANEKWS